MWIICAGAKRSGSTLQYNIVAEILENSEKGIRIPHFSPEELKAITRRGSELRALEHQPQSLAGKSAVMLFQLNSTRTRVAFEVGLKEMVSPIDVNSFSHTNGRRANDAVAR